MVWTEGKAGYFELIVAGRAQACQTEKKKKPTTKLSIPRLF